MNGGPHLTVRPIDFGAACDFVRLHHRHHRPPVGHKYSLAVFDGDRLAGVAIVGRPSSRVLQLRGYLEVTRTCTDGTSNANSCLYGAARREAMRRQVVALVTYTMAGESGASLRGAGWRIDALLRPRKGWDCPSRQRDSYGVDDIAKVRWVAW